MSWPGGIALTDAASVNYREASPGKKSFEQRILLKQRTLILYNHRNKIKPASALEIKQTTNIKPHLLRYKQARTNTKSPRKKPGVDQPFQEHK